ncbi:Uncharacterized protein AC509_0118 [Pseudomonas amygdali pv. morsprunorum]|nr:Uncharacterized protein AC509_0118 [Pseudomonas amygdali pv. morsprunorum]
MQLARRPAEQPPDQCQDSAVTYVAPCVVSAIAIKKRFFYVQRLRAPILNVRCGAEL